MWRLGCSDKVWIPRTATLCTALWLAVIALQLPVAQAAPGDVQFSDNFERATLGPLWTSSLPAVTGIGTQTANSPTRSAFTSNTAVQITGPVIPLSIPGAEVSVWIRRGADAFSEDTDGGENLLLQYRRNDGQFVTLATFQGSGPNGEILEPTFALPANALHAGFQLRFAQTAGSGTGFDFWHIDDVVVRELPPNSGPGGLTIGLCDDFENGLINFDIINAGGEAGVSTATAQSPVTSAFTRAGNVTIISVPTSTLFGFTGVSFFLQRGDDSFSENPDTNEDMQVSYIDENGNPVLLETFAGNGTPGQVFIRNFDLSAQTAAQHENFQLQFNQIAGSGASFDFWHIDDVCLLGALTPDVAITTTVSTERDPITATTSPKAIPEAELIYNIETTNQGPAVIDGDSVQMRIDVPVSTSLFVGDFDGSGSPLRFTDGADASGLSYAFGTLADASDSVTFLDAGDNPITPDDTTGFDTAVRAMRITLGGTFTGASASTSPSFSFEYRVRVE